MCAYVCMYAAQERTYLTDFDKIGTKIVNYTYVRIALGGVLEHFENQPHILNPQNFFFTLKDLVL